MEINVVCVGNIKEKYLKDAVNEYVKRLGAFCKINVIEVKDYDSLDQIDKTKKLEAENLQKYKKGYTIALEIGGESLSSEQLAGKMEQIFSQKSSTITFFIGGSNGLDKTFSDSLDYKLSFSRLTFPHQLMRVILLEQIYRAFMINSGRSYHK